MPPVVPDPLPLGACQVRALAAVTARELLWGRRLVSREIDGWRALAERIPEAHVRADALDVLVRKRGNTDGAALFWTLAGRRDPHLLRLLVAHEIIWDFLDNVSERGAVCGVRNGRQLHRAIRESLDTARPISDYYHYHPWRDDGGFLYALVHACRQELARLPSYPVVRRVLVREASRAAVQSLNHLPDRARRERMLRRWAAEEYPATDELRWFELTAAASASLVVHALLALAARPHCRVEDVADTYHAYFPWVSLATVMIDSYVDCEQDAASGRHRYVAHYETEAQALERLCEVMRRSAAGLLRLRDGERHAVVFACMAAMYLSKDSARDPGARAMTREIVAAGGSLTRLLVPILRLWRIRYGQQAA